MIRVFVNAMPVDLPSGATVRQAVDAVDPMLGAQVADGIATATDARGLALAPDAVVVAGSIVRAAKSARRTGPAETTA